ncbi:MAG: TIGR03663 family protein [Ardenticatenaceae bacterium]|nr:TIGR03663 family protein [Ardenticatenaceae bacterium]
MTDLTTTPESKTDFLSRPLLSTISLDWEKAIYITFIVLAILTRFWGLGDRVMSHDESLHTQFSYQYFIGDGYQHTPLMHGPFLFHATAVSYWLFGDSDFSARVPVAILGIILVAIPYLLRHWLGRIGALFASFIFLISPYITYYSRYIRHDIYVITWALIIFISSWFYLRHREEKYLWWFAGGLALMFSTKEVSFIYVAIFGSFLILRLLAHIVVDDWFGKVIGNLRTAIIIVALGVLITGGSFITQQIMAEEEAQIATPETGEGFAANPSEELPATPTAAANNHVALRWLEIGGIVILGAGLFLALKEMRPYIDQHPEFDLIILYTTLVLPLVSPLLTTIAGWNPRDYTVNTCMLEGQEAMSSLQLLIARMSNSVCWSSFMKSGMVHSGIFLIITLIASILVGLWWNRRRWLVTAVIFHSIFAFLYTSIFTNPGGWASGMIGSLGYWLEQQGVQRGSQPTFYYLFVVPFYEFLPVIFSLLAIRLWLAKEKINKIVGYWVTLVLLSLLAFSLSNWLYNRSVLLLGGETTKLPGLLAGGLFLGAGILFWFFVRSGQLRNEYEIEGGLLKLVNLSAMVEFVPSLIWWLLLTWVAYSYAGEKMPWLSTHFVIPMAFLVGWYMNERLKELDASALLSRQSWQWLGLTIALIVVVLLALGPILLGQIQLGNQEVSNLKGIGRFLGGLLVAGGLYYLWRLVRQKVDESVRQPIVMLGFFSLLSLLTIRFTYMASFPNADYTNEFAVYAHGAPATKDTVLQQLETLSLRMYGDKSIKVAFDNDVSWPFTWYLRDYPNRVYFGESPSHSLTESPVILVGSLNWGKVEPYLGNNYQQWTYTFLWWPMEEYRKISWNAIFGDPNQSIRRGLGNRDVRQGLWDIFFYRDYTKYGEVFGGTYTAGEWPLRHELRMYIRKDVLADLWDYGIGAAAAVGLEDPYAEKELALSPVLALNESGVAGTGPSQLNAPRNVDVADDGRIYVLDSGNHRIQVFDAGGQYLNSWGSQGSEPGQFNEPWGLAVDDQFVYVADTWNHRIQKFTLDGEFVTLFGRSGAPSDEPDTNGLGLFFGPRDIILLPDNRLLISDTGNHRLQIADRNGNFLNVVGNFGNLLGQFNEPVGLGTGSDGFIYLADTWNGRIQQFSPELFAVNEWPVDAWAGQSINNKPYTAVDSAGRIYVTDPEGYRVLIFNNLGEYLGRFGNYGTDMNSFSLPNGIAIDNQDNIYIADAGSNRILKFAPAFGAAAAVDEAGDEGDTAVSDEVDAPEIVEPSITP